MRNFRILGMLLIVGLVAWLFVGTNFPIGHHATPAVLGLGSAFEGNLQLPSEKITGVFDVARRHMLEVNTFGSNLRLAGDIAGWLSFAATAVITLIVGFFGRTLSSAGNTPNTEGLPTSSVRMIGFLAALAAVLTAFGNLSIAKSQDYFKRADETRDLIVHARAQVIDAKSADEAQAILDDLALKSKR
jgi:hypothetical protein